VRDVPRWASEEVGQPYVVDLVSDAEKLRPKTLETQGRWRNQWL